MARLEIEHIIPLAKGGNSAVIVMKIIFGWLAQFAINTKVAKQRP
ncbi:hypothetical protein [Candidatus Leptofilum sp.]